MVYNVFYNNRLFNCSVESPNVELLDFKKNTDSVLPMIASKGAVTCQTFTIGISFPITIETQIHYCCLGDSLCFPTPIDPCYNCGFVNDTTHKEIIDMRVSINDIDETIKSKSIKIEFSSQIEFKGDFYQIKCKEYTIDEKGFVTLEFEKKE